MDLRQSGSFIEEQGVSYHKNNIYIYMFGLNTTVFLQIRFRSTYMFRLAGYPLSG